MSLFKAVRRILVPAAVAMFVLALPAGTRAEGFGLLKGYVSLAGAYALPLWDSRLDGNYNGFFGGGIGTGFSFDRKGRQTSVGLSYALDTLRFKGPGDRLAVMNSFHFVSSTGRYVEFTSGEGVSFIDVPAGLYRSAGNNTGTELGRENRKAEHSYSSGLAVSVPLDEDVTAQVRVDLMSVDRSWVFWHETASELILSIPRLPFAFLGERYQRKGKTAAAAICNVAQFGLSLAAWTLSYRRYNWPWDDVPPVRYIRNNVGISLGF